MGTWAERWRQACWHAGSYNVGRSTYHSSRRRNSSAACTSYCGVPQGGSTLELLEASLSGSHSRAWCPISAVCIWNRWTSQIIQTHQGAKQPRWRWTPSHRMIKRYHTEQEKTDIKHNDVLDKVAKLVAKLPLPEAPQGAVDSITICNGVTPTPAKKWIIAGIHWMSWLQLRGTRRMTWITWLWGNVHWQGTGAPWERGKEKCPLCGGTHGTTVHNHLI